MTAVVVMHGWELENGAHLRLLLDVVLVVPFHKGIPRLQ